MKMNILVCLDSGYIPPLKVMLRSLTFSNPDDFFDIYVLHSSLTNEDIQSVSDSLKNRKAKIIPIKLPDDFGKDFPILRHLTKEAYFRIFAPWYLPEELDKILYLDPDITIIGKIDELYNTDLNEKCFAGASHGIPVTQFFNRMRLRMCRNSQYINSGVLLMNLKQIREEHSREKILKYIDKHGDKLYFADQDVINGMYSKKIVYFSSLKYNLDENFFKLYNRTSPKRDRIDFSWVRKNTSIIHYCGKNKPWKEDYEGEFGIFYESFTDAPVIRKPRGHVNYFFLDAVN